MIRCDDEQYTEAISLIFVWKKRNRVLEFFNENNDKRLCAEWMDVWL